MQKAKYSAETKPDVSPKLPPLDILPLEEFAGKSDAIPPGTPDPCGCWNPILWG